MSARTLSVEEMRGRVGRWVDPDEALPPYGIYVLARHTRGTWMDGDDQEGCNYVVVKRSEGNRGESNNRKDYEWRQFGNDNFWGQSICAWMYFPRLRDSP